MTAQFIATSACPKKAKTWNKKRALTPISCCYSALLHMYLGLFPWSNTLTCEGRMTE